MCLSSLEIISILIQPQIKDPGWATHLPKIFYKALAIYFQSQTEIFTEKTSGTTMAGKI
jgi:hypothetical protein